MRKPKKKVIVIATIAILFTSSYFLFLKEPKVDMTHKLYGVYHKNKTKDLTIHSFTTESDSLNALIEAQQNKAHQPETTSLDYESKVIQETYVDIRFQEKDKKKNIVTETQVLYNLKEDRSALLSDFFNTKAIRYLSYLNREKTPMSGNYNDYLEATDVMNMPFTIDETSLTLNTIQYPFEEYPEYLKLGDSTSIPNVSLTVPVTKTPIAFTFDDGPSEANTRKVMDILETYQGQGTFFVMGPRANTNHELIKETLDRNHQIGSHTYNHKNLTKLNDSDLNFEIFETERILQNITQTNTHFMIRPPYGAINDHIKEYTQRTFINWNIDSNDWRKDSSDNTCNEIVQDAKANGIILMHDLYDETVNSLACATKKLDEQGYQFVSVETLLKSQGVPIEPAKVYYNGN